MGFSFSSLSFFVCLSPFLCLSVTHSLSLFVSLFFCLLFSCDGASFLVSVFSFLVFFLFAFTSGLSGVQPIFI